MSKTKFGCCVCHKSYTPKYPSKEAAQKVKDSTGVEQWDSGVCSDECWRELRNNLIDSYYDGDGGI